MYWGAGPDLGLLTVLGYLFFVAGAASMWRAREVVFYWLDSEASATRRSLSRYTLHRPVLQPARTIAFKNSAQLFLSFARPNATLFDASLCRVDGYRCSARFPRLFLLAVALR